MLTMDARRNLRLLIDDAVKEAFKRHKFFSKLIEASYTPQLPVDNIRRSSIAYLSSVANKTDDLAADLHDIKLPALTTSMTMAPSFDSSTPKPCALPPATMILSNGRMTSLKNQRIVVAKREAESDSGSDTAGVIPRKLLRPDEEMISEESESESEMSDIPRPPSTEADVPRPPSTDGPPPLPPSPAPSSTRRSSDDMSISSQSSGESEKSRKRRKNRPSPECSRRVVLRRDERPDRRRVSRSRSRSGTRSKLEHKSHVRHRRTLLSDHHETRRRYIRERTPPSPYSYSRSLFNGELLLNNAADDARRQSFPLYRPPPTRTSLDNDVKETTLRCHSPIQFPKVDDENRSDERQKYTYFFTKKYPFSNHYPCKFKLKDKTYSCTEQCYMYEKAKLFNDTTSMEDIMATHDPKTMKNIGRSVSGFVQSLWDAVSTEIMLQANYAKYSQNRDLRLALFATEGTTLVETNPTDCVWGIGLSMDDSRAWNRSTWRGKNLLGQILTHIRDDMVQQEKYADELSMVRADRSQFIWWNY